MGNNKRLHNATDRVPLTHNDKVIDVYSVADLPAAILAPDGVMRVPLEVSAKYVVHKIFTWPKMLVPKQTQFFDFEPIDFIGARTAVRMDFDGDDVAHFWGRDIGSLRFQGIGWRDISNSGAGHGTHLFDLVGASGFSLLGVSFLPAEQFKRIGSLVDVALEFSPHAVSDNQEGYIARLNPTSLFPSNLAHSIGRTRFTQPNNKGTTAPMLVFQGSPQNTVVSGCSIDQQSGDSFLQIDSGGAVKEYIFSSSAFVGPANFFRPDISKSITVAAQNSEAITSFTDSATKSGFESTVNFATIQPFTRGQFILISGATQSSFNATHQITKVNDDQKSFDIAIVFSTDSTATLERTTITTSTVHGMVEGETHTIDAVDNNYDGTREILSISNDRLSFDVPVAFVGTTTGTVTSVSKTQKSIGVTVLACGEQADSKTIAEGVANTNGSETTISNGTYAPITLTNFTADPSTERLTLTTAATGLWTYDDTKPFSGSILAAISGIKSGTTRTYRFAVSINGATPDFATADYVPMEVQNAKVQVTLTLPVTLVKNNTVQIMVAGDGTAENMTVTDISMSVR